MKLVRYGEPGHEKPGLIHGGTLRDIGHIVPDLARRTSVARLARQDRAPRARTTCRWSTGSPRLGACVARPCNFIAVGLNYADHAAETGAPIPKEPILFNKAPNCIVGPERHRDAAARPRRRPTGRSSSRS